MPYKLHSSLLLLQASSLGESDQEPDAEKDPHSPPDRRAPEHSFLLLTQISPLTRSIWVVEGVKAQMQNEVAKSHP